MDNRFIQNRPQSGPATVFLPGWGFDGRIAGLIRPRPAWITPETLVDPAGLVNDLNSFLVDENINTIRLIGWSMGAYLALGFAGEFPDKVADLTLISVRQNWPGHEIRQLKSELRADPAAFLAGFYRKCFLGHKEAAQEFSEKLAPEYLKNITPETLDLLYRGLDYLATADARPATGIKTLVIQGDKDIIAPPGEMAKLASAGVEMLGRVGHLPFLASECSIVKKLRKEMIRGKFSRAASSYDRHALVQKRAVEWLTKRLPETDGIREILELGCGTGNYTIRLAQQFPGATISALDFSDSMLKEAAGKTKSLNNIELLCEDGEAYLAKAGPESFDLVTSNGTLQWFASLDQALTDIHRLLRPGGNLLFSIFGPGSLRELGQGIREIMGKELAVTAADFPDQQRLRDSLETLFTGAEIEEMVIEKTYQDSLDLLGHIKKTGTSGWRESAPVSFTRSNLRHLDQWFQGNHKGCKVTYQVFVVQARKETKVLCAGR